jgi:ribosome-associated toxin RatA of RatAB toxin-antitoxin module
MLKGAIATNTAFNNSTGHIAEMMIQGSNRGLTDMWKIINHHENAGDVSMEVAKELMDFEERNIERLKKYL